MSTTYSATAFYGYSLPRSELTRRKPNPLWGKAKFDPDTGDRVTSHVQEEIDLGFEADDRLPDMTRFTRFDVGYEENGFVMLGVQLGEMDLTYGPHEPVPLKLLSPDECAKVQTEIRKLLDKAGIAFKEARMGYYLAGYAG